MGKKVIYGLKSIKIGTIETDGSMATVLEQVGSTASGTAVMNTEDNQVTDIYTEESDSPIMSITTQQGKISFAWSCYDVSVQQMYKFFGGTLTQFKTIATTGSLVGGTLYTNGTYKNVALVSNTGTGTGAKADITVAGGAVTAVAIVDGGYGYAVGNTLTAAAADIGGTGSGFTINVATINNAAATNNIWDAPDKFPELIKSVQLEDANGTLIQIPKGKISGKFNFSFAKDKLGQQDLVVTVLQPDKSGLSRLRKIDAN